VLRCPKEISPYLQQIIELSINFISYDPNYDSDQMETDEEEEVRIFYDPINMGANVNY